MPTLTEIHDSPKLLAHYLSVPFEPTTEIDCGYGYGGYRRTTRREVTAEEHVASAWDEYRAKLAEDWRKTAKGHYRQQPYGQFLAECLREGFGVKTGKLPEKLALAAMLRPDLLETAEQLKGRARYMSDYNSGLGNSMLCRWVDCPETADHPELETAA